MTYNPVIPIIYMGNPVIPVIYMRMTATPQQPHGLNITPAFRPFGWVYNPVIPIVYMGYITQSFLSFTRE